MAQPKNIATVIQRFQLRFENELHRCRSRARARKLERKWIKTDTGVIDGALRNYRPLQNAMPGSKKVFKQYLTEHARHAVKAFEILFDK